MCCYQCGSCFKSKEELKKHKSCKHKKTTSLTGQTQNLSNFRLTAKNPALELTMDKNVLDSIRNAVSNLAKSQSKLICEYCRAYEFFSTENEVLEHIKSTHPIQCPDCPKKMFKYTTSLRKHFKKFHTGETPFFCKTCTLVFKDFIQAQDHMEYEHRMDKKVIQDPLEVQSQVSKDMGAQNPDKKVC